MYTQGKFALSFYAELSSVYSVKNLLASENHRLRHSNCINVDLINVLALLLFLCVTESK